MSESALSMQNSHISEAKSPLLFCTAAKYLGSNRAERNIGLRVQESEKDMSIKSITGWFENWMRYRTAVRELSSLTDRELNDLGIQRAEIDLVARQSLNI